MADSYYCERCHKTLRPEKFYTSHNMEKYGDNDGKLRMCKDCITARVDNWNSETYLWILQELDLPYIPEEWDGLLERYGKDGKRLSGTSIIGRYVAKMRLKQYKDYRWKDNDFIQELKKKKVEETMKRTGYDVQDIQKELAAISYEIPEGELQQPDLFSYVPSEQMVAMYGGPQVEEPTTTADDLDLTEEDVIYLRLKWGKSYKPDEWVALEQLYNEMMESYDIQSAGHIDNLKLLCKTSLKCNQLIDLGDVEGYQKMSKVYDQLMKSGKFTAAQNKDASGEFVDSVGELIELCEKQGYIERFYVEQPNDKVDFTLQDMQRYTHNLIMEETNLSNLIENAIKENLKEDKDSAENTEDEIVDLEDLTIDDIEKEILDNDFEDFNEFQEEEVAEDEKFYEAIKGSKEEE